jgi:hypothetical protein
VEHRLGCQGWKRSVIQVARLRRANSIDAAARGINAEKYTYLLDVYFGRLG